MKLIKPTILAGLACLLLLSIHSRVSARVEARPSATWQKVAVVRWTIVPRVIENAPTRLDQDAIFKRLSDEAGARTERLLLKRRMAASVEHIETAQAVTAPVFLTGTISLPISLPAGVIGLRARSQEGVFVVATVTLSDAAGKVLAREESSLNWNDAYWTNGSRRRKRNYKLDDVLAKFTRKAVDRAIEQLAKHNSATKSR